MLPHARHHQNYTNILVNICIMYAECFCTSQSGFQAKQQSCDKGVSLQQKYKGLTPILKGSRILFLTFQFKKKPLKSKKMEENAECWVSPPLFPDPECRSLYVLFVWRVFVAPVKSCSIGSRSGDWLGHWGMSHFFCLKTTCGCFHSILGFYPSATVKCCPFSSAALSSVWGVDLQSSECILLLLSAATP